MNTITQITTRRQTIIKYAEKKGDNVITEHQHKDIGAF